MIKPEITDDILHLHVEGMDKIWSFKSRLSIPLKHITAVRTDGEVIRKWWHGMKFPGNSIPGVLTAGTFFQDGKRVFWDVHHPKEAVVISLNHEKYDELVIEVGDPESFVKELREKIPAGF